MNINYVGNGNVILIAGGGKTYTDMAAKFCRSEKDIEDIIASPQNKKLLLDLVNSPHNASLEFDDFIFGVSGYARVTELQLVRKRHASYMIGSGRDEKSGKRSYDVVLPRSIKEHEVSVPIIPSRISPTYFVSRRHDMKEINERERYMVLVDELKQMMHSNSKCGLIYTYNCNDILDILCEWYTTGVINGLPEEDLRYMKPQATAFKAMIKMNASALHDWAKIRMCNRAQTEIKDLCTKIIMLAKEASPELMDGVGPSCKVLGYCPEHEQCQHLIGKIPTKKEALELIRNNYNK